MGKVIIFSLPFSLYPLPSFKHISSSSHFLVFHFFSDYLFCPSLLSLCIHLVYHLCYLSFPPFSSSHHSSSFLLPELCTCNIANTGTLEYIVACKYTQLLEPLFAYINILGLLGYLASKHRTHTSPCLLIPLFPPLPPSPSSFSYRLAFGKQAECLIPTPPSPSGCVMETC